MNTTSKTIAWCLAIAALFICLWNIPLIGFAQNNNTQNQYLPLVMLNGTSSLHLVEANPPANAKHASQTGGVQITFDRDLLHTTVTSRTMILHGSQTGMITATYELTEDNQVEIQPNQSFKPGELVWTTITTATQGYINSELTVALDQPYTWQFNAELSASYGYFMAPNDSAEFGTGDSQGITLGDLDSDGDLDALVVNTSVPYATVWVNDGAGTFTLHPLADFSAQPNQAVALGDLDNDTDLDAILISSGFPNSVWLNNGQGGFSAHPSVPTFGNGTGRDIVLGDLNGDGYLDAIVANTANEPETVWLNDGTGALTAHPTQPAFGSGNSLGLALGDLDGDYDLDMILANWGGEAETVWLNDGRGQFMPHPISPAFGAGNSQAIRLGDLDDDGDLDAVVANDTAEPETIWLNDGVGNFTAHPTTTSFGAGWSYDLALGDLDGDGDFDVLVANWLDEAETIWLNDGDGNFSVHSQMPAFGAGDSRALALGDLDSDGDLDAVIANEEADVPSNGSEAEIVWINKDFHVLATLPEGNGNVVAQDGSLLVTFDGYLDPNTVDLTTFNVFGKFSGKISGTFSYPQSDQAEFTPDANFMPGEEIVVSLTSGIRDLHGIPLTPFGWSMRVVVTGGSGNFVQYSAGSQFTSPHVYLGDLDRDGDMDVLNTNTLAVTSVLLNDGTGNFMAHPSTSTFGAGYIQDLGDLDRDGDLEVLLLDPFKNEYQIWENDSTGGFTMTEVFATGLEPFTNAFIMDYNLDGNLDILTFEEVDGQYWLGKYLNTGGMNFLFQDEQPIDYVSRGQFGDYDGDGDFDMIGVDIFSSYQAMFFNDGKGDFSYAYRFGGGNLYVSAQVGDVDGDADLDLVANQDFPLGLVWLNDGNGVLTVHPTPPALEGLANRNVIGDIDGDGDLDVFLSPASSSEVTDTWVNDGTGVFTQLVTSINSPDRNVIALADVDGDGDLDAFVELWGNTVPFPIEIWLNQP